MLGRMKLKSAVIALVAMCTALVSGSARAETASWDPVSGYWRVTKSGYTWYFTQNGNEAIIWDVDPMPSGTSLVVPSSLADFPVGEFAVDLCPHCVMPNARPLSSLTLPSTLRRLTGFIGDGQTRLTRLNIPSSVTYIEDGALDGLSANCVITFEGGKPSYSGSRLFETSPHPSIVYYKAGQWEEDWENGGTWKGVTTLREGSRFVTATFNGNGGAVRSPTVQALSGRLWGKMQTPIRNGYMFVGWYTGAVNGSLVTASSEVPNRDVTYYARWAPILSLGASLDGSGFSWSSDSWHGQSMTSHDGVDACRSGVIGDNGSTYLQTTVEGSGTISFWWKVSCEGGGYDALRFLVDGVQQRVITGEVGWQYVSISVTGNGQHRLKWNYTKDVSVTKGEDCGWVDQVQWTDTRIPFYFDGNGGSVRSTTTRARPGNLWGKMQTPVRSGYMFVGWYTSPYGGSLVSASSAVPSYSTTFYAHWTPILSLGASADCALPFTSDSWHGQSVDTHDGTDALRSGSVCDGQSTWLKTTVTGPGTLSFWWKVSCEGTGNDALRFLVDGSQREMITGEIGWRQVTVTVTGSGTHEIKWNYTKNSSVTKGEDCGWVDQVVWTPGVSYAGFMSALGLSGYNKSASIELTGNAAWEVDNSTGYSGGSSLRSGTINHNQSSTISFEIYSYGGYCSFYWKVSSESNYDYLNFYVDGSLVDRISGISSGWVYKSYYLYSGYHTLKWSYTKDGSASNGSDCGWIDSLWW